MPFCTNCGQQLPAEAKFCFECGKPVEATVPRGNNQRGNQRREFYDGEVIKCPRCGEILPSFTPICPTCRHELRNTTVSSAVQRLADEIAELEAKRMELVSRAPYRAFNRRLNDEICAVDRSIANVIRSFAIPNTKEDIYEFMMLASSNIDSNTIYINKNSAPEQESRKLISDAWTAKTEQAYYKAKALFGNNPDFCVIQEIYDMKMQKVNLRESNQFALVYVIAVVIMITIIGVVCVIFE